ncbi:MAG: hypothetical protein AAF153_00125 [Pseudomonadota bacterium]
MNAGANVNLHGYNGQTPLFIATTPLITNSSNDSFDTIIELINRGANPDIIGISDYLETNQPALAQLASYSGSGLKFNDVVKLVAQHSKNFDFQLTGWLFKLSTAEGRNINCLSFAQGKTELTDFLLSLGAKLPSQEDETRNSITTQLTEAANTDFFFNMSISRSNTLPYPNSGL